MKDGRRRIEGERAVRLNFRCSPTLLRIPGDREHWTQQQLRVSFRHGEVFSYRRGRRTVIGEGSAECELRSGRNLFRLLGLFDHESGRLYGLPRSESQYRVSEARNQCYGQPNVWGAETTTPSSPLSSSRGPTEFLVFACSQIYSSRCPKRRSGRGQGSERGTHVDVGSSDDLSSHQVDVPLQSRTCLRNLRVRTSCIRASSRDGERSSESRGNEPSRGLSGRASAEGAQRGGR